MDKPSCALASHDHPRVATRSMVSNKNESRGMVTDGMFGDDEGRNANEGSGFANSSRPASQSVRRCSGRRPLVGWFEKAVELGVCDARRRVR